MHKIITLSLLLLAGALGCPKEPPPPPEEGAVVQQTPDPVPAPSGHPPDKRLVKTVEQAIAYADNAIAFHEKKRAARPDQLMLSHKALMGLYAQKAQLTGRWAPFEKALAVQNAAFALAQPETAGPLPERAALHATLHKNASAEKDYDTILGFSHLKDDERAHAFAARADLKLQRGDMAGAEADFSKALTLHKGATVLARVAHFEANRGNLDAAREHLDAAIALPQAPRGVGYAWLLLQRGIIDLDAGRLAEADAFFERADAALPGWYLVAEHRAEVAGKQGQTDLAIARYRTIIDQTDNPEFMDALAEQLDQKGQTKEANVWRDKATARYEAWLTQFPEAAYGHAVDHFRAVDHKRALALAQKDAEARPGGRALTVLAEVLLAQGDVEGAAAAVERVPAGYSTADFHVVAAGVRTAQKRPEDAAVHKKKAMALSSAAFDEAG